MNAALRILFIDDSADDVRSMERFIRDDGHQVVAQTVGNLRDLRHILSLPWDLAFCEERLSSCTGLEALHVIHALKPDLPVVMVSRTMTEDAIISLLKAGAQNCLHKERLLFLGPLVRRELQDGAQRARRLEAERALRQSEERFRLLADNAFDVIWAVDLELRLTFIGAAVSRLLGVAPQEVLGRRLTELLPAADRGRLEELHGFYLAASRHDPHYPPFCMELEMQHRSGRRVVVEVSAVFLRDDHGRPTELQGISRDITMRRLMERDQAEQRQELSAIVARVPSLLLIINRAQRIHKVAGALAGLFGRNAEDMLGRRYGEALGCSQVDGLEPCGRNPACDGCPFGDIIMGTLEHGREEPRREIPFTIHRQGHPDTLILSVSAAPLQIGGQPMALLSLVDITQERAKESSLRLLSAAVEQSSNIVIILGLDYRITFFNARLTILTGMAAEAISGLPFEALIAAETGDPIDQDIVATVESGRFWEGEIPLRTQQGGMCRVRAAINPLRDERGATTHYVVIASDISELLRVQEEAQQHHQRLMQADKMMALGTLVAGVAHEVNNPASFISLNTPLLEDAWTSAKPILDLHAAREGDFLFGGLPYGEMREQMPQIFAGIRDGLARIRTIVSDLKDFSRQGPVATDQVVDVNAVIRAASSLLAGNVRKATQRFTVSAAPGLPLVLGNFQRLEQVVINLVQNACEALTDPSQAIAISTRHDAGRGLVTMEVSDQGQGMAEELLPRITEPFFTTRARNGGTGLGLSIVATIVKEHRGELDFSSTLGVGTRVTVSLPQR